MRNINRRSLIGAGGLLALAALAFMVLMPFLWMLSMSFKSNVEILSGALTVFPERLSLEGYRAVAENAGIIAAWFRNSVAVTVSVVLLSVLASAIGGYVFAKFRFRGKNVMFVLILSALMVPFQVTMIPIYLIMKSLHLINSLWALVLPAVVSPFGIFLCRQFAEQIPQELLEASRMDGAGEFRTFFRAALPQLTPVLSALAIFSFMGSWNDYLWPLIVLNEQEKMTISLAITLFKSQHTTDFNATMAMAALVMTPVLGVFLAFQKQFIRGMTLSGMK